MTLPKKRRSEEEDAPDRPDRKKPRGNTQNKSQCTELGEKLFAAAIVLVVEKLLTDNPFPRGDFWQTAVDAWKEAAEHMASLQEPWEEERVEVPADWEPAKKEVNIVGERARGISLVLTMKLLHQYTARWRSEVSRVFENATVAKLYPETRDTQELYVQKLINWYDGEHKLHTLPPEQPMWLVSAPTPLAHALRRSSAVLIEGFVAGPHMLGRPVRRRAPATPQPREVPP